MYPVTILFILYGAEEEGLYGSITHAQSLVASGNANKVKVLFSKIYVTGVDRSYNGYGRLS